MPSRAFLSTVSLMILCFYHHKLFLATNIIGRILSQAIKLMCRLQLSLISFPFTLYTVSISSFIYLVCRSASLYRFLCQEADQLQAKINILLWKVEGSVTVATLFSKFAILGRRKNRINIICSFSFYEDYVGLCKLIHFYNI